MARHCTSCRAGGEVCKSAAAAADAASAAHCIRTRCSAAGQQGSTAQRATSPSSTSLIVSLRISSTCRSASCGQEGGNAKAALLSTQRTPTQTKARASRQQVQEHTHRPSSSPQSRPHLDLPPGRPHCTIQATRAGARERCMSKQQLWQRKWHTHATAVSRQGWPPPLSTCVNQPAARELCRSPSASQEIEVNGLRHQPQIVVASRLVARSACSSRSKQGRGREITTDSSRQQPSAA